MAHKFIATQIGTSNPLFWCSVAPPPCLWSKSLGLGVCVGKGSWHEAMVLVCLPLAAPIGLSPLCILTLCGPERGLVVASRCTFRVHAGFADSSTDLCALVCASAGSFS